MGRKSIYSQEFKDGAVRLSIESGKSVRDVASELGISEVTLAKWRSAAGVSSPRGDANALREARREIDDLKRQLKALEKEKRVVEVEREILKKAAAFFARENP
jgi:transposase